MSGIYDEDYYKSVNYLDYLNRGGRYDQLADEIMGTLNTLGLGSGPILDYGCAVGHLLASLKKMGYNNLYGVDISEWALEQARHKGLEVHDKILDNVTHGVTFSLDVFEHMEVDQLNSLMQQLQSRAIVIRVPVCRNAGEDYVLECSRADPTHVIRWTKNQWKEFFSGFGYVTLDLNLHTIYNSDGVFSAVAVDPSYLKHEFMS